MAKKGILLKEEVGFTPIAPVSKGKPASSGKKVNNKPLKK